ncbi:MAG TPA: MFS transporter [Rugosimonospora sp.]|nr:MFS transporter [Rugosimonospora sp.]
MPRLLRDPVTWLVYMQLGAWAYFLYGFSPVVPLLRDEQHVSRGVASLHSVALAVGAVLAGAVSPYAARRLGRGNWMWLCLAGAAGGVAIFCLARPIWLTVPSVLVASVFGSGLIAGVVATLGERHGAAGPAAIAEANAIACASGAVAPLLIGVAVGARLTWRPALAVVILLIVLVAAAALIFRVRVPASALPSGHAAAGRLPGGYWIAWLLMCATGSVEVCINLWSSDLLRTDTGVSSGAAATAVSGIIGGMALGRLVGGRLALYIAPPRLLLGMLCVSAAGFALFWLSSLPALAVAGLIVLGLGNGMHYPLGIGMALGVSGDRPDQAAARANYGLFVSFGLAPFLLGAVADRIGPRLAFLLIPCLLVAAALLVPPLARRLRAVPVPAVAPAISGVEAPLP